MPAGCRVTFKDRHRIGSAAATNRFRRDEIFSDRATAIVKRAEMPLSRGQL
jgi:hypothetical protein